METAPPIQILRGEAPDWEDADPRTFTGRARIKRLGGAGASPKVKLYRVAFEPGARTHWHVHTGAQLLVVVEGRCLIQRWQGPIEVAETGDVAHIAPGEKHWHGAGPEAGTTHIALNVDAETRWLEPAPRG